MDNPHKSPAVAEPALRFHCPHCNQSLTMPANVTAMPRKSRTCPKCKQSFELEIVVAGTQRQVLTYLPPPAEPPPVSPPMEAPPIAVRPVPVSAGQAPPGAIPHPVSAPPSRESEDENEDSTAGRPWLLWATAGVLGAAVLGLAAALVVMFLPERDERPVTVSPQTPPPIDFHFQHLHESAGFLPGEHATDRSAK